MEDRGQTDCVTTPTGAELRRLPLASAEPRRTPCRASSQQMTKTYKYYSHQSILTPPPSSPRLLCYPPPLRNILNVIHKPDVHNVYITLLSEKGLATATGNMYMKFDV